MTEKTEDAKTKKPWHKKWWVWVIAVVVLFAFVQAVSGGDDAPQASEPDTSVEQEESSEPEPVAEEEPEPEPEVAPEPEPERFSFDAYELDNGLNVDVRFEVADNLTQGMIKSGAQRDTVSALEAAIAEHPEAATVWVFGSFPTTDQYGNEDESDIVSVVYNRETIDKINFDNIDPDNIWALRDGGMLNHQLED